MTSPPEQITVECPGCGQSYRDWWRPSINLALDDFDEEYLDQASSATCDHCGMKVCLDTLIVRVEDGTWAISSSTS